MIPKMFLMSGPSGSGKTTFAKQLAERTGYRYLCIDDFYALMNGSPKVHEHEFDVWIEFFRAIHIAEEDGADCIIDTNSPSLVSRGQFLDWFPGFEHHLITIWALIELCRQNNNSRERVVPPAEFRDLYTKYQEPYDAEDLRWKTTTHITNRENTFYVTGVYGEDRQIVPWCVEGRNHRTDVPMELRFVPVSDDAFRAAFLRE